jgi:hypothetical protein
MPLTLGGHFTACRKNNYHNLVTELDPFKYTALHSGVSGGPPTPDIPLFIRVVEVRGRSIFRRVANLLLGHFPIC